MEPRSIQEVSLVTRFQTWFEAIPIFTRSFLAAVVALYVLGLFTGWPATASVCLSAHDLVHAWQAHRILTSVLFHAGILHVAFNMLTFVPIGQELERMLGTLQFAYLNLLLILLSSLLYTVATYMLELAHVLAPQCAVGASGIIFGLIVVDNALSPASHRSILGLFNVPAKWYPWALLLLWQLLMPDISFIGHLSGILVGEAYARGWLDWVKLSSAALTKLEDVWPIRLLLPHPGFILRSGVSLPASSFQAAPRGGGAPPVPPFQQMLQSWVQRGSQAARGGSAPAGGSSREDVEEGWAPTRVHGSGGESSATFEGPARQLGGSKTVDSLGLNPRAAAAAAAEARLGLAPGSGSQSRAGGSSGARDNNGKEPSLPHSS